MAGHAAIFIALCIACEWIVRVWKSLEIIVLSISLWWTQRRTTHLPYAHCCMLLQCDNFKCRFLCWISANSFTADTMTAVSCPSSSQENIQAKRCTRFCFSLLFCRRINGKKCDSVALEILRYRWITHKWSGKCAACTTDTGTGNIINTVPLRTWELSTTDVRTFWTHIWAITQAIYHVQGK